jgi:hypothetical protein
MERRCSKCKQTKNLRTDFYRYKRGRDGFQAQCKACMRRYKRTDKSVERRKLHRERETGYRVWECPGRIYRRGAEFSRNDFLESLSGMVWPDGMIVEDIASEEHYMVRGTVLLLVEVTHDS